MSAPIEAVHGAVGLRIRMMRETLGLTHHDLIKRIDKLDRASLANIESGRQRLQLHTIEKFANAMGTSPKHLLKGIWW